MAPTTQQSLTRDISVTKDVPTATKQAPKRPHHSRRRRFHHHTNNNNSAPSGSNPAMANTNHMQYYSGSVPGHQTHVLMPQMVLPAVPMANLIPSQWALYPDMKVYQQVPIAATILPAPHPAVSSPTSQTGDASATAAATKAQKKEKTATANALATVTINPIVPIKDLPESEMELELDEPITFGDELGDDMYDIDDDLTEHLTGTQTEEDPLDMGDLEDPMTSDNSPSSRQGSGTFSPTHAARSRPRSILKRTGEVKEAKPKCSVTFTADTNFIERTLQFEIEKANPSFRRQRKPRAAGGSFADANNSAAEDGEGAQQAAARPVIPTNTPNTALSPPPSASDNSGSESGSDYPKDLQRALGLQTRKISDEAREEARKAAANRRRTRGTFKVV